MAIIRIIYTLNDFSSGNYFVDITDFPKTVIDVQNHLHFEVNLSKLRTFKIYFVLDPDLYYQFGKTKQMFCFGIIALLPVW